MNNLQLEEKWKIMHSQKVPSSFKKHHQEGEKNCWNCISNEDWIARKEEKTCSFMQNTLRWCCLCKLQEENFNSFLSHLVVKWRKTTHKTLFEIWNFSILKSLHYTSFYSQIRGISLFLFMHFCEFHYILHGFLWHVRKFNWMLCVCGKTTMSCLEFRKVMYDEKNCVTYIGAIWWSDDSANQVGNSILGFL